MPRWPMYCACSQTNAAASVFKAAEKQAMEAPVKLVFPLVVFIFPVTFIVLLFPIAMKFISEGML